MDIKLLTYLEKEILPLYEYADDAHGKNHIENVVEFAMKLSQKFPEIKPEMVITACAYHDIGCIQDRKDHHIISHNIVLRDKNLLKWFTEGEIEEIAKACLEHRASSTNKPTTLLSKIVCDADKSDGIDIIRMIERSYFYKKSLVINTNTTDEEIHEEVYEHLNKKFGNNGYVKFNLDETKELLNESLEFSRKILNNKQLFFNTLDMIILGRDINSTIDDIINSAE